MKTHPVGAGEQLRQANEELPETGQRAQPAAKLAALSRRIVEGEGLRIENHPVAAKKARNENVPSSAIVSGGKG